MDQDTTEIIETLGAIEKHLGIHHNIAA